MEAKKIPALPGPPPLPLLPRCKRQWTSRGLWDARVDARRILVSASAREHGLSSSEMSSESYYFEQRQQSQYVLPG